MRALNAVGFVRPTKLVVIGLFLVASAIPVARTQVIYAAPTNAGFLLFQQENGVVTRLNTGLNEHNFASVSRDSRFVTFSTPDGVEPALQVPPSSDVYIFDRVFGGTRRVIDTNTVVQQPSEVQIFRPVSPSLSPNNQILAYGLELSRRSGNTPNGNSRVLIVADAATGLQIDAPTDGRGPTSDEIGLEFVGLSWDPSGLSFVTPVYVNAVGGGQLPGIVRVARNSATGSWDFVSLLSTPQISGVSGQTQIYPAISPSGTGLAYFDLFFPDIVGGTQPVTARLIVANSDGSNPGIVVSFNPGFFPLGLAWTRDGTQLVFAIAQQVQSSTGFFPLADPTTSVVRQVSTGGGTPTPISGISNGFFPSVPAVALLPSVATDTRRPTLRVRGRKTIETQRKRVVIRGSARDSFGIADIAVRARGAKVRKTKVQSRDRFKVVLQIRKPTGTVSVNLRAIDNAGNRSKQEKVRILRR